MWQPTHPRPLFEPCRESTDNRNKTVQCMKHLNYGFPLRVLLHAIPLTFFSQSRKEPSELHLEQTSPTTTPSPPSLPTNFPPASERNRTANTTDTYTMLHTCSPIKIARASHAREYVCSTCIGIVDAVAATAAVASYVCGRQRFGWDSAALCFGYTYTLTYCCCVGALHFRFGCLQKLPTQRREMYTVLGFRCAIVDSLLYLTKPHLYCTAYKWRVCDRKYLLIYPNEPTKTEPMNTIVKRCS